ncbi:MAG: hypothetical protein GEU76_13005 [Alphaproteobacteria bacterium]|nr:hypothetical protein [Alphaproteobacteria bacterium]
MTKILSNPLRRACVVGLFASVLMTGCAGYSLVKGGEHVSIGSMSVQAPGDWNHWRGGDGTEFWTLDGPALQHILFVKGVGDDEAPWPTRGDRETVPKFRKGMSAIEISELVQATLANEELQNVRIVDLKPDTFGGHPGFSFTMTMTSKKGLDMKGLAHGAVIKDKLYMTIYRGAALHFFDRGLADYEMIAASLRIDAGEN